MERTASALVRIMDEKGVSVRQLARETDLSLATIRRLRTNGGSGTLDTWKRIADALGVNVGVFVA